MRLRNGLIGAAAFLILAWAMLAQAQRGGSALTMPPVPGSLPAHKFEKVAEGVYFSTSSGSMNTGSNGAVIVNAEDVLIIDPGITPAAARAFIADVKTLTNKPVKYVVDTHYHYDHAFGNQVFGPDVIVIGHDMTRRHLMSNVIMQLDKGTRPAFLPPLGQVLIESRFLRGAMPEGVRPVRML